MFGISSFCLHHHPLSSALDTLSSHTDLVEIMDDGPHFLESTELLESYSLRYAFHAPARSVNIASLHEPIRKASVEVVGQCFHLASEMGSTVVIHPGYFAWEEERDRALRQFMKSLEDLKHVAGEYGVTFYIENMANWNYFFLRTPDELGIINGIGLALDVGHAHLNHCLPGFLTAPISHVHLHDNDGKDDTHLEVGKGSIDFGPVMEAITRDRAVPVVEVATLEGTLESIKALEKMTR
ncbi:MAG TPA: sugar phosphate isomerase/epimerase family protein [Methanolinea sp.]|nr:sugar phosphate isomerase/epimerase family protein [Methanolinea sp.]HQK55483.1 sugar phosphate isomerase/epimerase family protein [Methanolinea sp.]